jgi:hypothetical protein
VTPDRQTNEGPARAELGVIVDRLRELRRRRASPAKRQPGLDGEHRVAVLEERVKHLEATLEALQDAVDRQAVLQDERFTDLRKRTAPEQMARALSEDARRRGV